VLLCVRDSSLLVLALALVRLALALAILPVAAGESRVDLVWHCGSFVVWWGCRCVSSCAICLPPCRRDFFLCLGVRWLSGFDLVRSAGGSAAHQWAIPVCVLCVPLRDCLCGSRFRSVCDRIRRCLRAVSCFVDAFCWSVSLSPRCSPNGVRCSVRCVRRDFCRLCWLCLAPEFSAFYL